MTIDDGMVKIAGLVADALAEKGLAFVEDDKLDGLAVILQGFLVATGTGCSKPEFPDKSRW